MRPSGLARWRGREGTVGREEKWGVPSPSRATLFFWKVIAFTPVGDLGRFNHTISSPGQLNQIGQINRGSTGEGFTSLSLMLSPASSLSLCVCLCQSLPQTAPWLSCSPQWLSWHRAALTKLNSWVLFWPMRGRKTQTILKIDCTSK